ncbi:MAG: glutathione S-transferase family protein [Caulobacterales bacterium]
MILYSEDSSPYCAPVRAAIYAKGLPIQIEPPLGGFGSEAYRRLTGAGTIPCLMLDDGSPLPESAAILAYLDDKFPDRPLRPDDPEGRAKVFVLARLAEGGIVGPIVQFFHDLGDAAPGAREKALERITLGLERIDFFVAADGYASGPEFSQADCVLAPALFGVKALSGMLGEPELLAKFPKLSSYAARAGRHPAIAKVLGELQTALAANSARLPA